jgi:hypothetical protein
MKFDTSAVFNGIYCWLSRMLDCKEVPVQDHRHELNKLSLVLPVLLPLTCWLWDLTGHHIVREKL